METPASEVFLSQPSSRNPRYERWRWQIFCITWLAYAGFYMTRKAFWIAKIDLGEGSSVGLTLTEMSYIELTYGICYAIGQFAFGMSADLFGSRKVVFVGLSLSAIVCFSMGLSNTAIGIGFLLGLQGLCQSTGWAPLCKNVNNFFSQHERGRMMGLWGTNYAIGGFIASIYVGWWGSQYGVQYAFFAPAFTLLIVIGLFFFLQCNQPEDVGLESIESYHDEEETVLDDNETPAEEPEGSWKVVREVLSNRMILLLAITYFFLKPTRYAIFAWGPLFMSKSLNTDLLESGGLSALFELAGPISIFIGGFCSDRIFGSRRIPVCVICLLPASILLFVLPCLPVTKFTLGSCFFCIGLFLYAPDSLVSGTSAIDFGTKKGASTAVGIVNGCGSIGAILGLFLPGFIMQIWGWNVVFWFLGGSLFIAFLLLLPQWNTLPKTSKKVNCPSPVFSTSLRACPINRIQGRKPR